MTSLFVACAAGFLAALMIAVVTDGPGALLGGLFLGFVGIGYSVQLATLPALLLGSLLWLLRVRSALIWAGVGAMSGLACLGLAKLMLGADEVAMIVFGEAPTGLLPIFMVVGAIAALLFRVVMRAFAAYDGALGAGRNPL